MSDVNNSGTNDQVNSPTALVHLINYLLHYRVTTIRLTKMTLTSIAMLMGQHTTTMVRATLPTKGEISFRWTSYLFPKILYIINVVFLYQPWGALYYRVWLQRRDKLNYEELRTWGLRLMNIQHSILSFLRFVSNHHII